MLWDVPPWGLRTTVPGHPWDSFHPTRGCRATLVHITWSLFMDCGPQTIQGIFLQGWSWNLSPSWGPIGMGCRSRVEAGMVHLLGPYFRAIGLWGGFLLVDTTSLGIGTRWQVTPGPRGDRLWISRGPSSRWESTSTLQGHRCLGFMDNVQWLCFNNLGYRATGGFAPTWTHWDWIPLAWQPQSLVWLLLPVAGTVRRCHERIEGFVVGC